MHNQSVEARVEALLAQRDPRGQLDALGKSPFRKIGKLLKKVAPIAIGAAGLYFGGVAAAGMLKKGGGKAPKGGRISRGAKRAARGAGKVAVSVAQDAAAAAISAGVIPLQPGALRSNEDLLSTAMQIATSQMMDRGVAMRSPEAQDIVRQAVQEAAPLTTGLQPAGFDWKASLPWLLGGGAVLAVGYGLSRKR